MQSRRLLKWIVATQGSALTNAATGGHNRFASQYPQRSPNGGIGRRASFRI
jgi:hypothetical protein